MGIFLAFGLFFALFSLFLARLVRVRGHDPLFRTTYECGPEAVGSPWVQLNVRFYIFGMLFVLFDVETLFIYPWALAYKSLGVIGFVEMLAFIAVLFLGLIYAWRKGALQWE
ncbi:MAG: NAD(P)H-quinone oxidoreductase subunit 3 [Elusimicrobia bacterium RIFCSPLOWO2_01_FULL_54_10]|nr:MAG: NAD(P)H-quinone oxidoreductase subunit 3 [Elusimicrobia bacterium RIFCSPLOWO2_01_FULL_54_10]